MRTTARDEWAAGDVIGEPMLETIAAKEGATAAENALMGTHRKIDFLPVPRAIFTSPQVASVGLTEKQAHEQGYECACRTIPMSKVPKAVVIRDTRGVVKMVVDASRGRILGVHILAENAADIIHEAVLAVKYKLTIDDIIDTVHVFPTVTRFHIGNRRIEELVPQDPTLHVVEIQLGQGRLNIICDSTHIFDKKDCLTSWLSTYTGKPGLVVSLPDYMDSLNKRPPRKVSPA